MSKGCSSIWVLNFTYTSRIRSIESRILWGKADCNVQVIKVCWATILEEIGVVISSNVTFSSEVPTSIFIWIWCQILHYIIESVHKVECYITCFSLIIENIYLACSIDRYCVVFHIILSPSWSESDSVVTCQ